MNVLIETDDGTVSLDDTTFVPPPVGEFLAAAIERRDLTTEYVAEKSGVALDALQRVLNGEDRLDTKFCRKLERVFPKTCRVLMRLQQFRDYYETYGVMRPDSPLKRREIERAHRRRMVAHPA